MSCKSRPSLLTDTLPVTFDGQYFNSDYRAALLFFDILESKKSEEEKAIEVMDLFFPKGKPKSDPSDFIERFINPYGEKEESKKVMDFRHDAGLIYASFYQSYGIDLTTIKLHWWCFLELLKGLPSDTIMQRVIDIRTKKISTKMSPEERQSIVRAQSYYSLPDSSDGETFFNRLKKKR